MQQNKVENYAQSLLKHKVLDNVIDFIFTHIIILFPMWLLIAVILGKIINN